MAASSLRKDGRESCYLDLDTSIKIARNCAILPGDVPMLSPSLDAPDLTKAGHTPQCQCRQKSIHKLRNHIAIPSPPPMIFPGKLHLPYTIHSSIPDTVSQLPAEDHFSNAKAPSRNVVITSIVVGTGGPGAILQLVILGEMKSTSGDGWASGMEDGNVLVRLMSMP